MSEDEQEWREEQDRDREAAKAHVVEQPMKKDLAKPKAEPKESKEIREFKREVMMTTTNAMNPIEYAQTKKLAKDFIESRSVAKSFANENQVLMALLAGREMGMSTMESLSDLYFVNGILNIYGKATPAALRRHGWRIKYEDKPDSCTATVTNVKTNEEIVDTFTFQEAEQSGFVKDSYGKVKLGWREGANRKRKLRYGVLSLIIHTYLPEVLGGAVGIGEYSEDYTQATDDNKRQTSNAATIDDIFARTESEER